MLEKLISKIRHLTRECHLKWVWSRPENFHLGQVLYLAEVRDLRIQVADLGGVKKSVRIELLYAGQIVFSEDTENQDPLLDLIKFNCMFPTRLLHELKNMPEADIHKATVQQLLNRL